MLWGRRAHKTFLCIENKQQKKFLCSDLAANNLHQNTFFLCSFLLPVARNIFRGMFTYERLAECVCVRELFSFPSAAHSSHTQVCIGDHRNLFIIVTRFSLWGVWRGGGGVESICGDLLVAAASCLFITESQRTVHRLCTLCSVCRLLNRGNVKRMKTFCNLARQLDGCMHFQVGKLPYESIFPLPNRVSHDQSGSSKGRKS